MQIHSAKFSQWLDNSKGNSGGAGGAENGGKGGRKNNDSQQEGKNLSLAELQRKSK